MLRRTWIGGAGAAIAVVLAIASPSSGLAQTQRPEDSQTKRLAALAKLGPKDFLERVRIEDDVMDPVVRISTEGFKWRGGFAETVRSSQFFRAIINRKTGDTTLQLYISVSYTLTGWRFFETGSYLLPAGLRTARLVTISRQPNCTYGCVYTEDVAFNLPEADVRTLASSYEAGQPKVMRFKLFSRASFDWSDVGSRSRSIPSSS